MTESAERKEKFTPGPWKAELPIGSNGYWNINAAGIFSVATCYGENAGSNATLIAAAPDMYAALEGLVDMIETELSVGSGLTCDFNRIALQKARAALSKARSES